MKKVWISSKLFAFVVVVFALLVCAFLHADAEVQQTLAFAIALGLPTLMGAEFGKTWAESRIEKKLP